MHNSNINLKIGEPPVIIQPFSIGSNPHCSRRKNLFRSLWQEIKADFRIIFERDPAARNKLEVLLCYPGWHALVLHRIAHRLHCQKIPLIPLLIASFARFLTGIDIHPGARLGRGICIDHGMGVVIGETAMIGNCALIYQGVTLGGTGKDRGKRHPNLGHDVIVGAGAKVLGNIQIGDRVRIGAGAVVLNDVPPNSTVVGIPGRVVRNLGKPVGPLEHGNLPDVQGKAIAALIARIDDLERQLQNNNTPISPEPTPDIIPNPVCTDTLSIG